LKSNNYFSDIQDSAFSFVRYITVPSNRIVKIGLMRQDEQVVHIGAEDVGVTDTKEMMPDDGLLTEVLRVVSSTFERKRNLTR
jgi:hypothetical protein